MTPPPEPRAFCTCYHTYEDHEFADWGEDGNCGTEPCLHDCGCFDFDEQSP